MVALVTGTSSGIGLSIAQKFLEENHQVIGFDREEGVLSCPGYRHVRMDICEKALPQLGRVDYLINCAGTLKEEEALAVNLEGTICFTQAYVQNPYLKSILFIASASARNGAEFPYYVASKAGLVGYMKNLALTVAKRGITCNSISPGGVITPANDHILKDERLYRLVKEETLLGKWAKASEVADLAYFLVHCNRSITGEDILMDNGEMLKSNFIW